MYFPSFICEGGWLITYTPRFIATKFYSGCKVPYISRLMLRSSHLRRLRVHCQSAPSFLLCGLRVTLDFDLVPYLRISRLRLRIQPPSARLRGHSQSAPRFLLCGVPNKLRRLRFRVQPPPGARLSVHCQSAPRILF